jgi:predicted  nucleic acid-binding Zn-ribbon protein
MSQKFKVDMSNLQKVQRTIRKSGNIFPNETKLVETLEQLINSAQDEDALNAYHSMAQYLKQRLKDLNSHLESPQEVVQTAIEDLSWSIEYLQWLVKEETPAI